MQQVLADLQRAFINFFERRARYPRFKSRKRDRARFRIPQRMRVVGSRVQVPQATHGEDEASTVGETGPALAHGAAEGDKPVLSRRYTSVVSGVTNRLR